MTTSMAPTVAMVKIRWAFALCSVPTRFSPENTITASAA
jgi:hypothetical protein